MHQLYFFCKLGNVCFYSIPRQNTLVHFTERSRVWKPLHCENRHPSYAEQFIKPQDMHANQDLPSRKINQ
jgi:hypothetical protein